VITICNFSKMCKSKYQISNDEKYVKEVRDNVTRVYCKSFKRYGRERYVEVEEWETVAWRNIIGNMQKNRRMSVESIFPLEAEPSNVEYHAQLLARIKDLII